MKSMNKQMEKSLSVTKEFGKRLKKLVRVQEKNNAVHGKVPLYNECKTDAEWDALDRYHDRLRSLMDNNLSLLKQLAEVAGISDFKYSVEKPARKRRAIPAKRISTVTGKKVPMIKNGKRGIIKTGTRKAKKK